MAISNQFPRLAWHPDMGPKTRCIHDPAGLLASCDVCEGVKDEAGMPEAVAKFLASCECNCHVIPARACDQCYLDHGLTQEDWKNWQVRAEWKARKKIKLEGM